MKYNHKELPLVPFSELKGRPMLFPISNEATSGLHQMLKNSCVT